jgi:hypothetical protein
MRALTITLFAAALVASSPAIARPMSVAALQRQWMALNEECRGGPDGAACVKRDRVGTALERRGVCWAYSDFNVFPTEYRWHDCRKARP